MRESIRLYGFRRGLIRASCVIAVSDATKRDVENLLGVPGERIRQVYSAPDPRFFGPDGVGEEEMQQVLERYQIQQPFLLYAGRIRPHKNLPRLSMRSRLFVISSKNHPVYNDLRLIMIGDEISKASRGSPRRHTARNQHGCGFSGLFRLKR